MLAAIRVLMLLVTIGSLLVVGISTVILNELRRPAALHSVEVVTFSVQPGQATRDVVAELKRAQLIRHPMLFELLLQQRATPIRRGTFRLSPAMTMGEIIAVLSESALSLERSCHDRG
jgi:cell division protein YceG involved in septum cleavage